MKQIYSIKIRFWLPFATFLILLTTLIINSLTMLSSAINEMYEHDKDFFHYLLTTLKEDTEKYLRRNQSGDINHLVTNITTIPAIERVLVLNENNRIIYANQFALQNKLLKDTNLTIDHQQIESSRNKYQPIIFDDDDKLQLHGFYAFKLPIQNDHTIRSQNTGIVYVVYNYGYNIDNTQKRIFSTLPWIWSIGLLLIAFVIYLANRYINKPISILRSYSNEVASGQYKKTINIHGHGDFASLATAIKHMQNALISQLNELESNQLLLEERVKERTDKLYESEKLFRQLFEKTSEAMILTDGKNFLAVNQAAVNLYGLDSKEELLKTSPLDLSPLTQPDGSKSADKAVKVYNKTLQQESYKFEWLHKRLHNDEEFMSEVLLTCVNTGKSEQAYGIIRDISLQKKHEQAINNARKKAEDAKEAKSQFLANMSHEIRTPMNAIIGMSYLAMNQTTDKKIINYLQKIHLSGENLLGIINDILDFSKIEAGKLQLEHISFNLRQIIHNVNNIISLKCEEKNILYAYEIAADVPENLIGDPLRLTQVLLNLANNAVKFTARDGTISIIVKADEIRDNHLILHFWICDNGIGMTEQQQERLFTEFSQADTSTTRKYGGSGLGLSISKHLVEMMNGKIAVESTYTEGSIFHFTCRLGISSAESVVENMNSTRQQQSPEKLNTELLKNKRVLLVEDNLINQELIIELLISQGLTVEAVNNGLDAVNLLRTDPHFDCVLMDCQMPVMDGYSATRQIRSITNLKDLAILALTANVMKQDQKKALDSGMNDFIAKPINVDLMFQVMNKWINKNNRRSEILSNHHKNQQQKVIDSETVPVGPGNDVGSQKSEIYGIDIKTGLKTTMNNKSLYFKLLKRFKDSQSDFEENFRGAMNISITTDGKRAAHSLKGLAANLSINGVQKKAQDLEFACAEAADDIEEKLQLLLQELNQVIGSLQQFDLTADDNQQTAIEPAADDKQQTLSTILSGLKTKIDNYDVSAAELLQNLSEEIKQGKYAQQLKEDQLASLIESIDNYDFDTAQSKLKLLINQIITQ